VVIRRGAPASVLIGEAVPSRIAGRAGKLVLQARDCMALDGDLIALEGQHVLRGAEYVEESAAIAGMICCLGIFLKGSKAEAHKDTIVSAFVAEDTEVLVPSQQAPADAP
jgi:hypothetical protein